MDASTLDVQVPERVFRGFRIATMAAEGTALARRHDDHVLFRQPNAAYGAVEECAIGVGNGKVLWVAPAKDLPVFDDAIEIVDGAGRWLTPGLIDCHTHLVYGGNRASEWEMRLNGVSYQQIARAGGGILSSVRATREASEQQLLASARVRLKRLLSEGITTIEIKSGYGLDLQSELKMLRVARELEREFPVAIETTLLAAHALPPEFEGRSDDYIQWVCKEMIPAARDLCSSVDVFCETIAFDVAQSKQVLETALANGLQIKVHAEQLSHTGIAAIAAEMGALSVDHLEYLKTLDCPVLERHQTVATILPGAFYCLSETQKPPVDAMAESGVAIALATDANPGSSPVASLLLMANMGCNLFGLSAQQALDAITVNAAKALGLDQRVGRIQPGFDANFAVWCVDSPAEIIYGVGHNPCAQVYFAGTKSLDRGSEFYE